MEQPPQNIGGYIKELHKFNYNNPLIVAGCEPGTRWQSKQVLFSKLKILITELLNSVYYDNVKSDTHNGTILL